MSEEPTRGEQVRRLKELCREEKKLRRLLGKKKRPVSHDARLGSDPEGARGPLPGTDAMTVVRTAVAEGAAWDAAEALAVTASLEREEETKCRADSDRRVWEAVIGGGGIGRAASAVKRRGGAVWGGGTFVAPGEAAWS